MPRSLFILLLLLALIIGLLSPLSSTAQNIGINANGASPHSSALLDIDASAVVGTKKGLLIPRMTTAEMNAIASPATGLLVFNSTLTGFFFFNGTVWTAISGAAGWGLGGNMFTNPATNFIGTADNQPLRFRVNSAIAGTLSPSGIGLTAFGFNAGAANNGNHNTFIGGSAGQFSTSGQMNTFVGSNSGIANTTGSTNTFIGFTAGTANTIGSSNTMVGNGAGMANTTGSQNTYVGAGAGLSSVNSSGDAFFGANAGVASTGSSNTFLGGMSGSTNTTGGLNVFVGSSAGNANTTGDRNTILGALANVAGGTLTNATAIGGNARVDASHAMVLGSVSGVNGAGTTVKVGIGTTAPADRLHVVGNIRMVDGNQAAGKVLTSDANGTATWQVPAAPPSNTWALTGNLGTNPATDFIGTTDAQPLRFRVQGTWAGSLGNTTVAAVSFGLAAGQLNTGINNTFIGGGAGQANTSGFANTFLGGSAGATNSTGVQNTMVGHNAGFNSTTAAANAMFGAFAGVSNTTGANNAFLGNGAGGGNTIGGENTFVGMSSGDANTTGTGNTVLGSTADVGSGALQNATAIGNRARVDASNALVLGSVSGVNGAGATTSVGIGVNAPLDRLHVVGSIRMVDGNQGVGRVPVSDANGRMIWTDPLSVASGLTWTLSGNSGTNPATNFIGSTDNQPVVFRANNVELIRMNTAGRVEIGSGGAAVPNVPSIGLPKLWVASASTNDDNIIFQASHNNPSSSAAFITAKSNGTVAAPAAVVAGENMGRWATVGYGATSFLPAAGIRMVAEAVPVATHVPSRINFETDNEQQRMTIRSGGNVGINTTDPLDRLHVVGNIRMVDGNQAAGRVLTSDANGTASWQALPVTGSSWNLLGNAGTDPNIHFIGTTNNQPLRFRVNGVNAGQLPNNTDEALAIGMGTSITGTGDFNTFIGTNAGALNTLGFGNTFVGNIAGDAITTGFHNTLVGFAAGTAATGSANTMVGQGAGSVTTGGGFNSFFGTQAGQGNTLGTENIFVGETAGATNTTGSNNTVIGSQADVLSNNLSNAIAIGYRAQVDASNSMVLGSIAGVNAATANTNVGIGVTTPLTRLDIDGALTIRKPADVAIVNGANTVTVGDRSYLRLNSNVAVASATINLSNGLSTGQMLVIESLPAVATNGFTVNDNTNTNLQANRALGSGDTLMLIWNGADWVELSFSAN